MPKAKEKEVKFEDALKKLERIVGELEGGELPLDDSLKKYEEGVGLVRVCAQRLEQVERRVEVLTKKAGDKFNTELFDEKSVEEES